MMKNDKMDYISCNNFTAVNAFADLVENGMGDHSDCKSIYRVGIIDKQNNRWKCNYGSTLNVNTISTFFNSGQDKNITELTSSIGMDSNGNYIVDHGLPEIFEDIFSEKYICVAKGAADYSGRNNYVKLYENDEAILYENINCLPLGFCMKKDILNVKSINDKSNKYLYEKFNPAGYTNSFVYAMSGVKGLFQDVYPQYTINNSGGTVSLYDTDDINMEFVPDGSDDRVIDVEFFVETEGEYYLNIKYNSYEKVSVYINDVLKNCEFYYDITQGLMYVGELKKDDKVNIRINNLFKEPADQILYLSMGLSIYNKEVNDMVINYLRKNPMIISNMPNDYIECNCNLDEDQVIFTSIPYDEGWHIFEGGTEIKKERVAGAFIGLDLGKGDHKLTFRYSPQRFYLGLIISAIFGVIFVIYIIKKIKMIMNLKKTNIIEQKDNINRE